MVAPGSRKKFIWYSIIGVVFLAALIFGSSFYGQKSLAAESSKIAVVFPAGIVEKPTKLEKPGGGTVSIKPVSFDLEKRGLPKKMLNPGVEKLSISSLTNIDTKPHRIGVKLITADFTMHPEVQANIPWDEATSTFTETIKPGKSVPDLSCSWYFDFTAEAKTQDIWFTGNIIIFDADTGEDLTTLPVKYFVGGQK